MNIGMLATTFPRWEGDWINCSVYDLCKKLVSEGFNIQVVAPHHYGLKKKESWGDIIVHRFQYMFPAKYQVFSYDEMGLLFHLQRGIIAKFQFVLYMFSFLLKSIKVCRKVNLIHAHWLPSGLVAVLIKKIIRKPVVLTPRGFSKVYAQCYPEKITSHIKNWFFRRIVKYVLSQCDKICATSSEVYKLMLSFDIDKNKIEIIPNWIDMDKWSVVPKSIAKKKLNLNENNKIILFVGRLSQEKGLEYLIKAVSLAHDNDFLTLIIGSGPDHKRLSELIEQKSFATKVKMLGSVAHSEICYWMQAADIFVLPSLYEEFGVVLLEAMVSRTPVIGTSVGGISDIITPDVGFIVPPKNAHLLAEKLHLLLADESLRSEMGKNARKRVEEYFTWPSVRASLLSIYRDLIRSQYDQEIRLSKQKSN